MTKIDKIVRALKAQGIVVKSFVEGDRDFDGEVDLNGFHIQVCRNELILWRNDDGKFRELAIGKTVEDLDLKAAGVK